MWLALRSVLIYVTCLRQFGLQSELLDLVVVVLAVEDVPLLRAFDDDLALRGDFHPGCSIDTSFFSQEFFERLAGFLPDRIAILKKIAL